MLRNAIEYFLQSDAKRQKPPLLLKDTEKKPRAAMRLVVVMIHENEINVNNGTEYTDEAMFMYKEKLNLRQTGLSQHSGQRF